MVPALPTITPTSRLPDTRPRAKLSCAPSLTCIPQPRLPSETSFRIFNHHILKGGDGLTPNKHTQIPIAGHKTAREADRCTINIQPPAKGAVAQRLSVADDNLCSCNRCTKGKRKPSSCCLLNNNTASIADLDASIRHPHAYRRSGHRHIAQAALTRTRDAYYLPS